MQSPKISIPEPCAESWEGMTPKDNGRHCTSCNKTVVDFTAMSLEEIQGYFEKKQSQKVCGHFLSSQVEVPTSLLERKLTAFHTHLEKHTPLRFFKTISLSAILFLMTLTGCRSHKTAGRMGNVRTLYNDSPRKKTELFTPNQPSYKK